MTILQAVNPAVPILVVAILGLWSVAGWLRIHRLARHFQECLYDRRRYSQRLSKLPRERREVTNAFVKLLAIVVLAVLASGGRYAVPGVAAVVALYSGFLAVIDMAGHPVGHHRGYTPYAPEPHTTRLIQLACVIDALPLIVYLVVLVISLFTGWDRLLIAFWGAATGAFVLLLTPLALPVANLFVADNRPDDSLVETDPIP